MEMDLSKEDLISLVKGTVPHYNIMDDPLIKDNGSYLGGFHDTWNWSENLKDLDEETLYEIFKKCKQSWKK